MEQQKTPYCIRVEPFMVNDMWPKCLHFLENPDIGDIEFTSLDDLKEECKELKAQLWILMEDDELKGCFLTNIGYLSDKVKVVNIFHLCGDGVKVWVDHMDKTMVDYAKENGCKFYLTTARRGFSRLVPALKESGVLYAREING